MTSKTTRQLTLFEAVKWGTSKQVQEILEHRDLTIDDQWTDYALLISALRRKHKEIAKILINKGCRIHKIPRDNNSDTPLHFAVKIGDTEFVKILLSKGASINDVDHNGETSLCFAMKKGNYKIVDMILSTNNIENTNTANNDGFSHFHIACIRNNVQVVENFLKLGVNVNTCVNFTAKDYSGYTPLHFAVENECTDVVKLLLDYNADITIKNAEGASPLHLAIQKKNDLTADLILSAQNDKNSNSIDNNGLSHFHIACMKSHLNAVKNFLNRGIDINHVVNSSSPFWPGYTALHFAVKGPSQNSCNQTTVIKLLLNYKADVNIKDIQGQTPLHLACLQTDKKISKLIQTFIDSERIEDFNETILNNKLSQIMIEQIKVIELLLEYKSDVNVKNIFGETCLFYLYKNDRSNIATKRKNDENLIKSAINVFNLKRKEIVQILLNHNADVNIHNDLGQTMLHLIASINEDFDDDQKEETAELILNEGANVDEKTKYGSTPLHIAAKNGHSKLIELFLKYNANVNSSDNFDQSTPLHLATSYQQVQAIDVLLQNEADVTAVKSNGMNVLHIMALINPESSEEVDFREFYEKIITSFLERGCDINAQDINGRTPLHLAAWDHNNAATWALLQHFADINVEDNGGETPLSFPINSTERCVNIYCMFKDYVNMLRITGLPISEKTETCYNKCYGSKSLDLEDDFLVQCKEEIVRMQNIKINNYASLYDVIFKNSNEMEIYSGNETFENILKSDNFDKNFNIYGKLLKSQYRKGSARKILLKNAKDSLIFLIGFNLPHSCIEKIFLYMDDKSLNNLIKAKTIKITDKKIKQIPYSQDDCASLEKALAYCKNLFNKQVEMEIV